MERRMMGNYHVRCGVREKMEIISKSYLSLYFAPSSEKSWNYTSFRGTTWASGTEDVGFMGLYATAYGEPLDVYSSYHYQESDLIARDKNCVHAHKGIQLRNDEIIYYNEKAMVLNYVVRFK